MIPIPPAGLRERKDAEVKRAFYEAAMELFREKGFTATSADEIAARAGYSRATFFNHFGTKKGVFRYYGELLSQDIELLLAGIDTTLSPLERVREILFSMAREADTRREELKVVFLHSSSDPDYLAGPTSARQRIGNVVRELVTEAQHQGEVRSDMSAEALAFHILSLYHGAVVALVWDLSDAESSMESAWHFLQTGVGSERPTTR